MRRTAVGMFSEQIRTTITISNTYSINSYSSTKVPSSSVKARVGWISDMISRCYTCVRCTICMYFYPKWTPARSCVPRGGNQLDQEEDLEHNHTDCEGENKLLTCSGRWVHPALGPGQGRADQHGLCFKWCNMEVLTFSHAASKNGSPLSPGLSRLYCV